MKSFFVFFVFFVHSRVESDQAQVARLTFVAGDSMFERSV
jgi:hypothetical protein